ncbi:enoyl-CoA hydratase/isomerase family protein [Nocardia salmonicida]|uniref:enoyl-CoA hydratase/isomerase family protein n=1 Tax=Nocardia salmonicida TaxID=53431 RepID=UPI0033E5DC38
MANDDLRVEIFDNGVAEIEMLRGPNNFFDVKLLLAIADSLELLAADSVRAAVLCSEGRHFCAGAQLGEATDNRGLEAGDGMHLYDAALRLFEQPLPIVAAVQGAAIGGGLGLALAADFRIAAPQARFSANFARLGFHHGFGMTVTLPAIIGMQAATRLLYTGERVTADQALLIGLCDAVEPLDGLRPAARSRAANIAASAPLAIRSIRKTMRQGLVEQVRAAVVHERKEQERLMKTADFKEGVTAVSERRDPQFLGV